MLNLSRSMKIVAAGLMLGGIVFAQTPKAATPKSTSPKKSAAAPKASPTTTPKPAPVTGWRTECSKAGGYCIEVPKAWKALGEVFDGAGFVVAEPDARKSQDDWNQITAAATDMPEPPAGQQRPTTDELIDIILGSPSSGIQSQTLQRSTLVVAGMPAQVLKVRLRSKSDEGSTDAIEFIALLDDDETIYSVALGCAPEDASRLEAVFEHVLHSWKATPPAATPPQR